MWTNRPPFVRQIDHPLWSNRPPFMQIDHPRKPSSRQIDHPSYAIRLIMKTVTNLLRSRWPTGWPDVKKFEQFGFVHQDLLPFLYGQGCTSQEVRVYLTVFCLSYFDDQAHKEWPTTRLVLESGLEARAAKRAVAKLKARGLLQVMVSGRTRTITLPPRPTECKVKNPLTAQFFRFLFTSLTERQVRIVVDLLHLTDFKNGFNLKTYVSLRTLASRTGLLATEVRRALAPGQAKRDVLQYVKITAGKSHPKGSGVSNTYDLNPLMDAFVMFCSEEYDRREKALLEVKPKRKLKAVPPVKDNVVPFRASEQST